MLLTIDQCKQISGAKGNTYYMKGDPFLGTNISGIQEFYGYKCDTGIITEEEYELLWHKNVSLRDYVQYNFNIVFGIIAAEKDGK